MKHLFVPYPLAVLAKEKGFEEPCLAVYHTDDKSIAPVMPDKPFELRGWCNNDETSGRYLAAPLYSQIIDWFREKHKIVIYPDYIDCYSLPVWCIKWHTNAYMESFVNNQKKALEQAFNLLPGPINKIIVASM